MSRAFTATVLPETAVRWAWGLTLKYSEAPDGKLDAQYTQDQMKETRRQAKKNSVEARYLDNLYSAVDSYVRTLVISINGRNRNFKEVQELIDKQEEIVDNTKRLTGKMQSIVPRLAAVSVGGIAIPSLFTWGIQTLWPWDPKPIVSENLFPLFLVFAIGFSFLIHERVIVPRTVRKHQQLLIYGEYSRDLYYAQWVIRAKLALKSLLEEGIQIYEDFFGSLGRPAEHVKQFVEGMTAPIEPKPMCTYVHKCLELTMRGIEKRVVFDRWSKCESGVGLEQCEIYKTVYQNGTLSP